MNEETEPQLPDDIGAEHIALLLTHEPVARSIVKRYPDANPFYTDPRLECIFLAARDLLQNEQAPSPDLIRILVAEWADHNVGSAEAAFDLLKQSPTDEIRKLTLAEAHAAAELCEKHMRQRADEPEVAPAPKPTFVLTSLADLAARPAPLWLIDSVLVCGGTSLMTAKHASFKSFFSLDMALCVATGREWHGYKAKQGSIVYVAAEGASGIVKRVQAWCQDHAVEMPENFHVIERPVQIHNPKMRQAFVDTISAVSPDLIVLDTLARCAVGIDENSATDMGEFADAIGFLARETGAHILTVHHNNKNGEYRGSSAVPAAVDTHLSLNRATDSLSIKFEKQKDLEECAELTFEKVVVDITPDTSSLVFRRQYNDVNPYGGLNGAEIKAIQTLLEGWGTTGTTFSQWWGIVEADGGVNKNKFIRAKQKLLDKGYVLCPDPSKRGATFIPNMELCEKFHKLGSL